MSTELLPQTVLEYHEGSSDKVYRAAIEAVAGGFVVNFAYGQRGSTLNTGTKTAQPVSRAEAQEIYGQLVRPKTAKGYRPVAAAPAGQGIRASVAARDNHDTGLRPHLLNPINEEQAEQYLDDERGCAQEKYDGRCMMIRKAGPEIVATNRDGLSVGFPDALARQLSGVAGDFVIDGEIVGETFYCFDLLANASGDLRNAPYVTRLAALLEQFGRRLGGNIVVARTALGRNKRQFSQDLKAADREGVVFKDLRAPWTAGRPAQGGSAMKCKSGRPARAWSWVSMAPSAASRWV